MDKPSGSAGHSRGRAQTAKSGGSGGGQRGRRNPQSSKLPGGTGTPQQSAWGQSPNSGAQGQNRGPPASSAPQPSAWGRASNSGAQDPNRGRRASNAPQQSAWGQPPTAGSHGQSGPPVSTAPQQSAWGQPPTAGAQSQRGPPVSTAPQQSAWGEPQKAGAHGQSGPPVLTAPQQSAWGQPQKAGAHGQSGSPVSTAPQQSAWGQPPTAGAQSQRGPPVSTAPQQSAWGQPPTAGQSGPPVSTAPQQTAWRQPSLPAVQGQNTGSTFVRAPLPAVNPQERPQPPIALGGTTSHRNVPVSEAAGGAVSREDARGSVRGRRVIAEIVQSRPQSLATKCGSSGSRVSILTNHFRILKKPKWSIHQYRVDFSPDVEMIRLRRAYLAQHKEIFGGYIFDGTILFCTNYFIPQTQNGQMELLTMNREGETIQIKIKHTSIVDVTDVQQIQVLNLIIRRSMEGLKLQLVGRNFFDPAAKINVDQYRMEIWPGYITSIRQHEQDILLCAEISHKVMRTDTVYRTLTECLGKPDYQHTFKQQVVGSIVLTDYNNKTYRVDDVDFQTSPLSKFPTKDGEISYIQYYQKRYNIKIRDQKQPMLVSRPTDKNIRGGQNEFILLIPEICRSTGLTDAMRQDFRLMRAMGEHTRLNPNRRIDRLRLFNRRLQSSAESIQVFASWNMQLDTQLVEVPGRILPPEKILFGNNRTYTCDQNADWTREFRNNSMFAQVDIKRWVVIVPHRNTREVQEFVKLCIRAAASMKMHISEPTYEELRDDRNGTYSQAIDKSTANDPQLLMFVLQHNNEEKYSCIKKKCCVDRPVPSQVVTVRTVAPRGDKAVAGLMSIATKVVIQMNAKLMGAPWMISLPVPGLMTVGFDVCHSAKDKNKSYGAFVATMDVRLSTKYYSAVTQHMKGQELSNEISLNMTCALKSYREVHGTLPERIIFYRDGVGEGQLHQVYSTEVKFLKKKLDEIYASAGIQTGCRMAFVVVSKRINTRYFVNGQNPLPGTVVDDIITLPERYDFFLVSQSVRQGTVSPTSYNVIHDNIGFTADRIQMLTYKMTHLYYNWSGTLRVPAVCQYAHKLAFLVAESIHRAPSTSLENQLYFL